MKQHTELLSTTDWLTERDAPVAIVLTETLEPSGGPDSIIFPPTYARQKGDHPYAITTIRTDIPAEEAARNNVSANICDLDSVGSQANRMEAAFLQPPLSSLVPQIFVKANGDSVSLLNMGHRIVDGAVRFAHQIGEEAALAIAKLARDDNAATLAKLAPTSLVFGCWDSRATLFRVPRVLSSTIRATNVAILKRSAQYSPAFDPTKLGLTESTEVEIDPDAAKKDPLSQEGLRAVPAVDTHGGVRVFGSIVRRTEINLVSLRALGAPNEEESLRLRRYLFGLALVAGRYQSAYNLRQGCLLTLKEGVTPKAEIIHPSGRRKDFKWDFSDAWQFAQLAASEFDVDATAREFEFRKEAALLAANAKAAKKARKAAQ
jgi:CRISPR-associated protein Csb1